MMKRMKGAAWVLLLVLLLVACLAVAAALFMSGEELWGVGMLVCAMGCCLLLFVEGYERGWDSAKEIRMETLTVLCRTDELLARGEAMFRSVQETPYDCEAEEKTQM